MPPSSSSRPSMSNVVSPATSGRRPSGRNASKLPSPSAVTRLPSSVSRCRAEIRVTTVPLSDMVPMPDQSLAGPSPENAMSTAGVPSMRSRLASTPSAGSEPSTWISRRLSAGTKATMADMLPSRPSVRATRRSPWIVSGLPSAATLPSAASEAMSPAMAVPSATSGSDSASISMSSGRLKGSSLVSAVVDDAGRRAISILSKWTREASKLPPSRAVGDQSTAPLRATSHGPLPSEITTCRIVRLPDRIPSRPDIRICCSGLDAVEEISPASLVRPPSVIVRTAAAPAASATMSSSA